MRNLTPGARIYRAMKRMVLVAAVAVAAFGQAKYDGPRPPKTDIPYLLHATNLISTEVGKATEETRKKDTVAWISGKASPVRTPLPEPIFLFDSSKVAAEKLKMFKLEVNKDRREVVFPENPKKGQRPVHLAVKKLSGNLYRIEADETLENGEYCLSPEGEQDVFCFAVY